MSAIHVYYDAVRQSQRGLAQSEKRGRGPFFPVGKCGILRAGVHFHPAALCAGAVHSHPPARRYAGGQAESGAGAAIPLAARQRDVPDRLRDQPAAGGAGMRGELYAGGRHPQRILWGSCAQDGSCSLLPQTGSQLCAGAGLGQGTPVRHRAGAKARGPGSNGLCPRLAATAAAPLGKAVRKLIN